MHVLDKKLEEHGAFNVYEALLKYIAVTACAR